MIVFNVFARSRDRKQSTSEPITVERAQTICSRPQDYERDQLLEAARHLRGTEADSDYWLAVRAVDWLRQRARMDSRWRWDGAYATSGLSGVRQYFKTKEEALHKAQRSHRRTGERVDVVWCAKGMGAPVDLWLNTVNEDGVHDVTVPEELKAVIRRGFTIPSEETDEEKTKTTATTWVATTWVFAVLFLIAIYHPSWLYVLPGWAWFILAFFIGGLISAIAVLVTG